METLLEFITSNKTTVIGSAVVVAELVVIVINTIKRCKAIRAEQVSVMSKKARLKTILWIINPINVIRKYSVV